MKKRALKAKSDIEESESEKGSTDSKKESEKDNKSDKRAQRNKCQSDYNQRKQESHNKNHCKTPRKLQVYRNESTTKQASDVTVFTAKSQENCNFTDTEVLYTTSESYKVCLTVQFGAYCIRYKNWGAL